MPELRVVRHTDRFADAVRFYGDVLGWPVTKAWDEPDRGRIFGYGATARVEVLDARDGGAEPAGAGASIAVEVASVVATHDAVVADGIEIVRPLAVQPWGHRNFTVLDPTGMSVTFFEVIG